MAYLLARMRMWAAHHRLAWWLAAGTLALVTGLAVDAAASAPPCPTSDSASIDDRPAPRSGERAIALDRGSNRLPLVPGDRVDLYAVDDLSSSGRLLVGAARVLDLDDETVTVAVPRRDVAGVTTARRWGDVALALVPQG
ncbi:MAG: hypothetical protein H8E59_11570 [Actinobacteria bacterium]|nr:hypothetical protein [Actinomycetota bacterium]